jgi:lipopolysaccharide transport system ATP-binding protein
MSDIAIRAEGLSKLYRLGARERYRTLRDTLTDTLTAPFRRRSARTGSSDSPETFWALKDVSFEVKHGEVIGIIGRNGAGKSTLLKILSRITEPTCGEARIHGRIASLLEVGTGFHPELSGRDNIYLNGAILGMKKAEIRRKFDEIVAFAEVEKFIDTPVKHYSSGMYVRLAFAVAAHLETEILIVDEVLAVGDATFQTKCLGRMSEVASQGRTVLFVSHNMTALKALCTRAIFLSKGEVRTDGLPHLVVSQYLCADATAMVDRAWTDADPATGNDSARLHSARIIAHNPHHITVADPLDIELTFSNFVSGASLNVTLHIHTLEGVCVLATASPVHTMRTGRITMRCRIPENLLNDGGYRIQILVVRNMSVIVLNCSDALLFEVHDSPRLIAWYGKWPGVIRPELQWDCQFPLNGHQQILSHNSIDLVESATLRGVQG